MNCDKILSKLSEYIDREIHAGELRSIEEHLAQCDACAHELKMLQETAGMISAVCEIEPPAFLLEQIEAVTINKPTLKEQVQEAFAPIFRIPVRVRWTAVTAVAAGFLAFNIMSQPEQTSQVFVDTPSNDIVAVQPIDIEEIGQIEEIEDSGITIVERTTRSSVTRPSARRAVATTKTVDDTKVAKIIEETIAEELVKTDDFEINPHIGTEFYGPKSPVQDEPQMIAREQIEVEPKQTDVQIIVASTPITDRLEMENEALQELREQIAVRNKQRQSYSRVEPIEKGRYLVELATIRF